MRATGLAFPFAVCIVGLSACTAAAHIPRLVADIFGRQARSDWAAPELRGGQGYGKSPLPWQRVADGDFNDKLRSEAFWREMRSPQLQSGRSPPRGPDALQASPQASDSGRRRVSTGKKNGGGAYRTVCVRLCDGYNWPISFATARSSIERDAKQCERSCESPAKLYASENQGSQLADMKDEGGRYYHELTTALLYQSIYDAACKCRPHPWEKESIDRHAQYATEAKTVKAAGR